MKEFEHANPDYKAWTDMANEHAAQQQPAEKAFRLFVKSEWQTLLEDRPELAGLSTQEGCVLMQEEARISWKELSSEDKQPFKELEAGTS